MMSIRTYVTLALALVAGNTALSAQAAAAPAPARPDSAGCCQAASQAKPDCMMQGRAGMGMGMGMAKGMQDGMGPKSMMQMPMPSAQDDARLDSLMSVLHQTKGDRKVAVMERVLDELLTQRAVMHEHMRQMMGGQH